MKEVIDRMKKDVIEMETALELSKNTITNTPYIIENMDKVKDLQDAGSVFDVGSLVKYDLIKSNDLYVSGFLVDHRNITKLVNNFYKKYPQIYKEGVV